MKRAHVALVTILFSSALFYSPAFSVEKSGTPCPKLGAKQIVGNKSFTCIKSGKKLVWNRGVVYQKPGAGTKVLPTPSAIPSPSSISSPPTSPTPAPTRNLKIWEQLRIKINNQNSERFKSEQDIDIQFITSPTVNAEKASETAKAYREAGRYWTKFYGSKGSYQIIWVLLSEKDYEWWRSKVTELEGSRATYPWDNKTNMFGHCGLSPRAFCGYGTTQIGASGKQTLFQYNVIGSEFAEKPVPNVVHHESTHFYQLSNNQTYPSDLPCWYIEGQATFYGNSLSMTNDRDWEYQWVLNTVADARNKSAEDWYKYLIQLQNDPAECRKDRKNYSIGSILWEYLLLRYSEEEMHNVLIYLKDHSWSQATNQILGISSTDLDKKLAEYISEIGRT